MKRGLDNLADETGAPDATAVRLLALLRGNGRRTIQSLADELRLAPATVSERVSRLRDSGVIQGIHARMDYFQLGYTICAYVALQMLDAAELRGAMTDQILKVPEVEEVAWIAGAEDVLVRIWAKDTKHLGDILVRIDSLGCRSRTMVVLGDVHAKPGIDFEAVPTQLVASG